MCTCSSAHERTHNKKTQTRAAKNMTKMQKSGEFWIRKGYINIFFHLHVKKKVTYICRGTHLFFKMGLKINMNKNHQLIQVCHPCSRITAPLHLRGILHERLSEMLFVFDPQTIRHAKNIRLQSNAFCSTTSHDHLSWSQMLRL